MIAWLKSYWTNVDIRNIYNRSSKTTLAFDDPMPNSLREEFVRQCGGLVNAGIEHLQKSVALNRKDWYSLAYLNLLLRQRADQRASMEARAEDLKKADGIVDQLQEILGVEHPVPEAPLRPHRVPPPPPPPGRE